MKMLSIAKWSLITCNHALIAGFKNWTIILLQEKCILYKLLITLDVDFLPFPNRKKWKNGAIEKRNAQEKNNNDILCGSHQVNLHK